MYRLVVAFAAALLTVEPSRADVDDELQLHAFVSQGYLLSSHDVDFLATSSDGSFEFFEAGLNVQRQVTDKLRLGIQLFTRDLGPLGNYEAKVDWAYLDYRWRDWLGFRAGRIKLPFGLYNDTSDIDAAHPTALLPQAVYPAQNRDFLLAQTGVELYGFHRIGKAGALNYRGYAGTIFLEFPQTPPGSPFSLIDVQIPYVIGGRVMWEPIEGLRAGVSVQRLRLETDILDQRDPAMPARISADVPATLTMASLEYQADEFTFAAEYARWYTKVESSDPMAFPETRSTQRRAYGLASWHANRRLTPSLYYGMFTPQVGVSNKRSSKQLDAAAALRIDLNSYWLLKLEAHAFHGTAGLSATLNEVPTVDDLPSNWLLFVAKTTVYF